MKLKDLIPPVEGLSLIVTLEETTAEDQFTIFLFNEKNDILEGIIITCVGYLENPDSGQPIKTSVLRHSLEIMLPNEAARIELIMPEVFRLYNEYWVSFWVNDDLFDKKFIIPPFAIDKEKMNFIEAVGSKGLVFS